MLSRGNEQFWWSKRGDPVSQAVGQRVKKRRKKLLVPVCEGVCMGRFFMRGGEESRRREGEREWTSLARLHPPRTRVAFHAHFINSNLSSAENWIRLIRTIDARLRPCIHNDACRRQWCTIASGHLNGRRRCLPSWLISNRIFHSVRFSGKFVSVRFKNGILRWVNSIILIL